MENRESARIWETKMSVCLRCNGIMLKNWKNFKPPFQVTKKFKDLKPGMFLRMEKVRTFLMSNTWFARKNNA